jgi:agmatinase
MYEKFSFDLVEEKDADVVFFGIELGRNARKMLDSLRKTSWFLEFFDVDKEKNLIEGIKIADAGNIRIFDGTDITRKVGNILNQGKLPFMLSKSHLATYYALRAFPKDIKIISFDAHSDTKSNYTDEIIGKSFEPLRLDRTKAEKYNAATWLRRSLEEGINNAAVIGLRSCDEFDLEFMKKNNVLYFTPKQIRKNLRGVKEKIKDFVKDSPVYLSVDMDVFDPSSAPAVDHPEADGIFYNNFEKIIPEICKQIIGIDLVEIEPHAENRATEFLAVKVIFQILGLIKRS